MERRPSLVILVVALGLILAFPARSQNRDSMVRNRMMADISELKDQLTQLNETVNQLQNTISELRRENQINKNRIIELERKLDRLDSGRSQQSTTESTTRAREDRQSKRSAEEESTVSSGSEDEWVPAPGQSYEIRREPLDHKVIYVTTDDTTLTKLAHKYYRDASFWRVIYELNRDKLPSPDVVPPGVNLVLPPVQNID